MVSSSNAEFLNEAKFQLFRKITQNLANFWNNKRRKIDFNTVFAGTLLYIVFDNDNELIN